MASDQSLPPGVFEALLPRQNRPKPTLLSSFAAGVQDVCTPDSDLLYNKYDLLCPRSECGSIILRTGVAKLLERPSVQMEPTDRTHSLLPSLPEPPANTQWWLITPSPMEFENIGFTKPVDPLSSHEGKQLKLLACAQCDLGPLGWCEVGGTEFWLSCSRVGYRVE